MSAASRERPTKAQWDARVLELTRMPKKRLVQLASEGHTWIFGGPEKWSKDELIAEILRDEFPGGAW